MLGAGNVTHQNGTIRLQADPSRASEINRALVQAGIAVSRLAESQRSLEEVFLELTEGEGGL
jgi:hypothetical protein